MIFAWPGCAIIFFMERLLKSRYRTAEKISENPFSVTYKGFYVGTDKPVIIKIYKRGTLSSTLINRMKQKVKDFALINYHGIAKMVDGDYGWQGFYYVREYIEGETLAQILAGCRTIEPDKVLMIGEEICRALEFAHARGIVHGAMKPSNVFVDSQGIVKLADFVVEGEIKEAMPQKALTIIDSRAYLSPEELLGWPANFSSDIYGVGLLLSELAGPNPPRYLQEIIKKALLQDPLLRFQSAALLRESLEKRMVVEQRSAGRELAEIFDSTVTQYGGEETSKIAESLEDVGRVRIRWSREKDRRWLLLLVLGVAIASGLLYAFFLGR